MSDPITQDAIKEHDAQIGTLAISAIHLVGALMDKLVNKGILQAEDKRQLITNAHNQLAKQRALGQLALDSWEASVQYLEMVLGDTSLARAVPTSSAVRRGENAETACEAYRSRPARGLNAAEPAIAHPDNHHFTPERGRRDSPSQWLKRDASINI